MNITGAVLPVLGAVGTGIVAYMYLQNMQNGTQPLQ